MPTVLREEQVIEMFRAMLAACLMMVVPVGALSVPDVSGETQLEADAILEVNPRCNDILALLDLEPDWDDNDLDWFVNHAVLPSYSSSDRDYGVWECTPDDGNRGCLIVSPDDAESFDEMFGHALIIWHTGTIWEVEGEVQAPSSGGGPVEFAGNSFQTGLNEPVCSGPGTDPDSSLDDEVHFEGFSDGILGTTKVTGDDD